MTPPDPLLAAADHIEGVLDRAGVQFTLGGEPTYVPIDPVGPEWSITAIGPTKLRYAYAMAGELRSRTLPTALTFYSPGKTYPGEVNPRWTLAMLWNRDGTPLTPACAEELPARARPPANAAWDTFCAELGRHLGVAAPWIRGRDPLTARRTVWILPLDTDARQRFYSPAWKLGRSVELLPAEGPAGLRLPLGALPAEVSRRALTIEQGEGEILVFLAPLLQRSFLKQVDAVMRAARKAGMGVVRFAAYLPADEAKSWQRLDLTADPGVLEINLPPCPTWREYRDWLRALEAAAGPVGLRSFKQPTEEHQTGTGGGNHLLFGGPTLDTNPFFVRPGWITSILRYWQRHPCLSYLFTGQYVGPSSQAPRPDESSPALYDLEMAYRFLEELPEGDHRGVIGETLRHLHIDRSGNTHRSESSFDKFWSVSFPGGCRGLIEFRAVESLPHADWMAAVALLWRAIATMLLTHPVREAMVDHGARLHDALFLPATLWQDLEAVFKDLDRAGFVLPRETYRSIMEWRFPPMLQWKRKGAGLTVRLAHEGWPLLCETPLEGGNTSRFVDTSIERLEFTATPAFARQCTVEVQGSTLPLRPLVGKAVPGAGLRYRRSALYPSLHPGIAPHMPLYVTVRYPGGAAAFRLDAGRRLLAECPLEEAPRSSGHECRTLQPGLVCYDLRLE